MRRNRESGFSLLEMLVSLTVLLLAMSGIASLLIQNSRLNKSQLMAADVQANARNTLEIVVAKLRSAGWDPMDVGFAGLALDPDLSDDVSEIEVFADISGDGDTADAGEDVLVRHVGNQVEWRSSTSGSLEILANNVSNDADGDGTPEPMFVPDDPVLPWGVTVRVTAQSPVIDPVSRDYIRYTVYCDVVLRKNLEG